MIKGSPSSCGLRVAGTPFVSHLGFLWLEKKKGSGIFFCMLLVTSGANKDFRPLIIPQEIDEETAREIPGAGCTWYPDEQPLSNEVV
jgi:hypothetical protein